MIVNKQKGRKKFFFNNQKGMALLTTLIFVFILVTFAVALLTMTSNDSKLSTLHRESTRAFYLAETGVDKALWYLNNPTDQGGEGLSWRTIDEFGEPVPLIYPSVTANEYYEFTVLTDPLSTEDPEIIVIKSTGKVLGGGEYNKGTRIVEVKLEKGVQPSEGAVYNFALMTFSEDSDLTLNGHSITIEGDVHSNGNLTGTGFDPAYVDGDITISGETNLDGDNVNPLEVQDFPTIDWDYYYDNADQVYDTDTAYEIGNEELYGIHYFKGDVTIKNDLLVVGTIVVDGSITVSGNPDITLLPGEKISLVMVASGDITLSGTTHVEGIIHTESIITLNGNINVEEGAILAENGVVHGVGAETKIVYDVDNQDQPVPGTGIPVWKKASWREVYL